MTCPNITEGGRILTGAFILGLTQAISFPIEGNQLDVGTRKDDFAQAIINATDAVVLDVGTDESMSSSMGTAMLTSTVSIHQP